MLGRAPTPQFDFSFHRSFGRQHQENGFVRCSWIPRPRSSSPSPKPFSATDSLPHLLYKLIPEVSNLGEDYVQAVESICISNPAFLMKTKEEELKGVKELRSAEGLTWKTPPSVFRAVGSGQRGAVMHSRLT